VGVVETQRRPHGALHAKATQDRLSTVVASADGDSLLIESRPHRLGSLPIEQEREDAGLVIRTTEQPQAGNGEQQRRGIGQQILLRPLDRMHADPLHVLQGRGQTHGVGDVAGTGLEALGRILVKVALKGDVADHVAAPLPGGHGTQQIPLGVENADAGGSVDLVTREHIEIHVQGLHIHRRVGNALGSVQQDQGTMPMGDRDHLLNGRDRAQGIGDLGEGDQLRAGVEQMLVRFQDHLAGVIHWGDPQPGSLLMGQLLPGHDVGVMLEMGEHDLIARLDGVPTPGLRYQIDRLGGAPEEHDLLAAGRVQKAGTGGAGLLISLSGTGRQFMGRPVDVGVFAAVKALQPLDHRQWLLGGGAVVKPHQLPPVDALLQDRKVAP